MLARDYQKQDGCFEVQPSTRVSQLQPAWQDIRTTGDDFEKRPLLNNFSSRSRRTKLGEGHFFLKEIGGGFKRSQGQTKEAQNNPKTTKTIPKNCHKLPQIAKIPKRSQVVSPFKLRVAAKVAKAAKKVQNNAIDLDERSVFGLPLLFFICYMFCFRYVSMFPSFVCRYGYVWTIFFCKLVRFLGAGKVCWKHPVLFFFFKFL